MREYHCTTCDFHITGPADDVADEIDAHEEQHHTDADAVSGIEVTPDVLRAVADWVDDGDHGVCTAVTFREEADRMEREQADEQRIDELADVFSRAAHQGCPLHLTPGADSYRAGIRAVLAKLDQELSR